MTITPAQEYDYWFPQRRFGLFIHWGLYAIPAWHEQLQMRGPVDAETYQKLMKRFNDSEPDDVEGRFKLLEEILGKPAIPGSNRRSISATEPIFLSARTATSTSTAILSMTVRSPSVMRLCSDLPLPLQLWDILSIRICGNTCTAIMSPSETTAGSVPVL